MTRRDNGLDRPLPLQFVTWADDALHDDLGRSYLYRTPVAKGSVMGIVGESGCGKSTLVRLILGLLPPASGDIHIAGQRLDNPGPAHPRSPDPADFPGPLRLAQPAPAHPRHRGAPLRAQGERDVDDKVFAIPGRSGLTSGMAVRYPYQLSDGPRQRVAIARALILRPRIIVCDEPTSALDVLVQAQILNLLAELRRDFGLTLIFISHHLAVVEHVATDVAVMYLSRIVERATVDEVFTRPLHPYTRALLASVLTPEPGRDLPASGLGEGYPDPANIPSGYQFYPCCPIVIDRCRTESPGDRLQDQRLAECLLAAD